MIPSGLNNTLTVTDSDYNENWLLFMKYKCYLRAFMFIYGHYDS